MTGAEGGQKISPAQADETVERLAAQAVPRGVIGREAVPAAMLDYFEVLGVDPAIGRLFNSDDDRKLEAAPHLVLSHDFWKRRFASDPRVVGGTVRVNGFPLAVIGVARAGFNGAEVGVAPDM